MPDQDPSELVDWGLAERVATSALRLKAPVTDPTDADAEDFAKATARAAELVEAETGLHPPGPPRSVVVDRAGWVRANLKLFRELLHPVVAKLSGEEAAKAGAFGGLGRVAASAEIGLLLGWMSGRVLGQYDLATAGEGVLYYVAPNVAGLEARHAFPRHEFRQWITLHEVTHHLQFAAVPWMRSYFLSLVERAGGFVKPDPALVLDGLRRAAAQLRRGENPLAESGLVGVFADEEQLATLREAQALMSLLEGHGNVMMDRIGEVEVPGTKRFSSVLSARRSSARGMAKVAQQALGFEAKARQYAAGETFITAVEEIGGPELFARTWESPEMLPSIEEIRSPRQWTDRVLDERR